MDKKDDKSRGKSPDRDRRRIEIRHETNRMDPHSVRCRIFIGNLATEKMSRQELEDIFGKYGHISGSSLHNNYGFVQYDNEKAADEAIAKEDGKMILGKKVDVHLVGDKRKKGPPPDSRDTGRGGMRGGRVGRDHLTPPRDRGRMDDYSGVDRYGSRYDRPDDRFGGRPLSPRREPYREPLDRMDDYHRDRYRDDPYDRREPPPRRMYDDRRDPYDYPPRGGDPYYDRDGRRDPPRRDDYHREGPWRDEPRRDEPRRDEPYSRYDSFGRDYPDDYGPPSKRSKPEYEDYHKPVQAPTDCVVIIVSKALLDYGIMVERKFKDAGLVTDLQPLGLRSMAELLDSITRHGVLYAAVVTLQHEVHRSITINILHGTPQEHRNMPLEDALRLVSQNFEQYMQDLRKRAGELDKGKDRELGREKECAREKEHAPEREKVYEREKCSSTGILKKEPDEMKTLLSKAASGDQLSSDELSKLIDNLSKQKKQSDTPPTQPSGGGSSSQPPPTDSSSIAKQQADLQAKIFSILNPSTLSKVSLTVAQSAIGTSSLTIASSKTTGVSNSLAPLFPAAKSMSASGGASYGVSSSVTNTSKVLGSTVMQHSGSYGSSAPSNHPSQQPSTTKSGYGVPKQSTPSWYDKSASAGTSDQYSKPAYGQQSTTSYGNSAQTITASGGSYGVPKTSPASYGVPKASPSSYGVPKANSGSYAVPKQSPQSTAPASRGGYQGGTAPTGNSSYGPPGRGAPPTRGTYQSPGRGGIARGGPPPGVTAVRGGAPPFHTRGPAPGGPPPRGFPARGGAHPPRYGVPAFRPPKGAPISTVQGRGRQPQRY